LALLELLRLAEPPKLPKLPHWLQLLILVTRVVPLMDQVLPKLQQPGIEPIQAGTCWCCWSY
jgi:hypothetical protein